MQDLHSSQIGLEAELEYRRRLLTSLRRESPAEPHPRPSLRAAVAAGLAHLALHLDGRSIGTVAAEHTQAGHQGHRGAA